MKSFKMLQFSIDFRLLFLIFSLASGSSAPEPPTNPYFQNFLKFPQNFCENFDKVLKNFKNSQNFQLNFQKIIQFSLIFLNIF